MTNMDPGALPHRPGTADPDWWRGAVIYQIYPRSFQDSNGDGVGDLPGITQRLAYIAALGVDAIWISPFFTSPMKDFGYDVSNYRDVDPRFGTLADFDALVVQAHAQGLKVMIDLVLSHTSDQHPWFQESSKDRSGDKSDWYVWADPKPDGTPPNNWLSIFGGPAWTWCPAREQYYLHNFLKSQPDLNFHNPVVQDALLNVTRFWLERGVDGFRLDTINFYFADKDLRDNPPLAPEDRNDTIAPRVNPYNHQDHVHSKNQPENIAFLQRFRALLDSYGARAAVGEVGDAQKGLEILGEYTSGSDRMHMCYAFEFLAKDPLTAQSVVGVLERLDNHAPDGWACWAFSNHDVMRHTTRWNLSPDAQRAHIALMVALRGTLCLYQGEELGLSEADVPFDALQDPYGIEFWPAFKGRDGCRTPMVWENNNLNGGFSDAKPWLPVSDSHLQQAVTTQEHDPASMLHYYRRALAFRRSLPALRSGDHADLCAANGVISFRRTHHGQTVFCAINLTDSPAKIALPTGSWQAIGQDLGAATPEGATATLAPWQPCFAINNTTGGEQNG